jgi:hypothetical protein
VLEVSNMNRKCYAFCAWLMELTVVTRVITNILLFMDG